MEISNKLCELINRMRGKEAMYVGKRDIFLFRAFWDGFTLACKEQLDDPLPMENLGNFTVWMAKKYDEKASIDWSMMLFLHCYGNAKEALNKFYSEWDLFCEEMKHPEHVTPSDDDLS